MLNTKVLGRFKLHSSKSLLGVRKNVTNMISGFLNETPDKYFNIPTILKLNYIIKLVKIDHSKFYIFTFFNTLHMN